MVTKKHHRKFAIEFMQSSQFPLVFLWPLRFTMLAHSYILIELLSTKYAKTKWLWVLCCSFYDLKE